MTNKFMIAIVFCVNGAFVFHSAAFSQDSKILGIVQEKPTKEPFVKTKLGYMVPYKVAIPESKAVFEMVPCPGGFLTIGSNKTEAGRRKNEGPQVRIQMEPFWMGKHEVTWSGYYLYMDLNNTFKIFKEMEIREVTKENKIDAITSPSMLYDPDFQFREGSGVDGPAANMTQFAAKQYTKWVSGITGTFYRLPTEAEWEYACRAGSTTSFSFGHEPWKLGEYAWIKSISDEKRHKVGTKKPNAWGIHDMHGNVSEWVLDQISNDYRDWEGGMQTQQTAVNWPKSVYGRVVRGGSFQDKWQDCRSALRRSSSEDWKDEDPDFPSSPWWLTSAPGVGFRVMRPLSTPKGKEAMNVYWKEDHPDTVEAVKGHADECGKGARGLVDKDLPKAVKNLEKKH